METQYLLQVTALEERRAAIALHVQEAERRNNTRIEYKFRIGGIALPIISLPIDFLIYRLENYRTRDTQLSLIAAGKEAHGFFDPERRENATVQLTQHKILFEQAQTGSGETITPIYSELGRVAMQTEDLIISADGIVVNGNRRLSAMRELWASDPAKFSKFSQVSCSVLPESASPTEILKLEIGLQMQPETKLPYEWTALGRAVRDLRDSQVSDEEIALLMNRERSDIIRAAKMIDNADLYLSEWLDKPQSYDQLAETEQAFKQIALKNNVKGDDAGIRDITRQFDFLLIEQRKELSERAYLLINSIEQNATLFLDNLASELKIELPVAQPKPPTQMKISFEPASAPTRDYEPLVHYLQQQREDPNAIKRLTTIVEQVSLIAGEQGKKKEFAALEFAQQAERKLSAVDVQTAGAATHEDLRCCLERCINICESLLDELSTRQAQGRKL